MNSRQKGKTRELELSRLLRDAGYPCRRGQQYSGASGDADIIGLPGIHIECKRCERIQLRDWLDQAIRDRRPQEKAAVFHRANRTSWTVTMRLEDWIEIYREWEAGQAREEQA